jgi:hypothetical protein
MSMSYSSRRPYDEEYEEYNRTQNFEERRDSKEDYDKEYDDYCEERTFSHRCRKFRVIINTMIFCEEGMYKKTKKYEIDCDDHKHIVNRIDCAQCQEHRERPKMCNKKHS